MSMLEWIDGFPSQLIKAVEIFRNASYRKYESVQRIHISGLGGSGIGGTLATGYAFRFSPVPVTVSKGYDLPAWVNENTLVITCSYSGNTEETLSAFDAAVRANARITCITSGGELEIRGKNAGAQIIKIPAGFPPRTCLGYSLVQLLKILETQGCVPAGVDGEILSAARLLENGKKDIQQQATHLTAFFAGKSPVLYASDRYAGVAERWTQQINENAKLLCHFHVVPEMNHNEMVGWRDGNENRAVLFMKGSDEDARNMKRMEICMDVIKKHTAHVEMLVAKGETYLEQMLYMIYIGDWISLYLADSRHMDPVEIRVIELLKGRLAE